jgi:predicted RNA-binding Zn-ribbon protein involved in translation (DUF1610 family)
VPNHRELHAVQSAEQFNEQTRFGLVDWPAFYLQFTRWLMPTESVISCPNCSGQLIAESGYSTVGCPHCGEQIWLERSGEAATPAQYQIVNRRKTSAGGIILELIGFFLLFVFPIGTIIGVCLIALGYGMSKRLVCGFCGNQIADKDVRMCPTCRNRVAPKRGWF